MEHVDTLITARWIIPIEPSGVVFERHAIAIRQGRVIAIEPEQEALLRFSARERIERPHHVLIPGLVNAHTHAAMTLLRGAAEANSLGHWLTVQIEPLERRWMDAEYVRDGTELAIADMLTSGTTCFGDVHQFPEVVAQVASAARVRASVGLPVMDAPTLWSGSADECFEKGLNLHDEYRSDPLITTAFAPSSPSGLSDATLMRVRRGADELEMPIIMNVNENRSDAASPSERTIARLERLGFLSPLLGAVHLVNAEEEELDAAARGGIHVIHCPQSNLKLGNGIAPIPSMVARGMNIALGTNGAASNNDLSLLDEMRTAALLAAGGSRHLETSVSLTAHDWLRAATLGSARALGLGDCIGSLAVGKWADVCCVDLARAHTQPVYDPAAHLVHAVSRDQVSDVWVAGRALLSAGALVHLDLADILDRAGRWQDRIASTSTTLNSP